MTKHIDKETRSQMVCLAWAFAEMQGGRIGTQDLIELWARLGYPRVSWQAHS